MDKARQRALLVLMEVNEDGKYANISLKEHLDRKEFNDRDISFITQLVYGTLENQTTIDRVLKKFAKMRRVNPRVENILRMGAYQILYLDKVPDSAACNEAVKLCIGLGLKPLKGFVNGVLRNISRNKKDLNILKPLAKDAKSLSILYGFPLWLVELWIEEYGVEIARMIIEYSPSIHWVNIRINKGKTNRQRILKALEDGKIQIEDGLFFENALRLRGLGNVQDSPLHQQGLYTVQGESSMLVCRILDPRPHERILDTCSAPGGKAIYIAELMNMKGKIYAWDIHDHRVGLIEKNLVRMGATIVDPKIQDATVLRPELEGSMDRVLIDAPCSGWGVLHKKPDIKLRIKEGNMASLYELQRRILESSSSYVKPGGVLVYSTCTINPLENNKMVEAFLEDHPEFTLEDFTDYLPSGLRDSAKEKGMIQLIPGRDGIDGFFIAKLRRTI